jgi:hypothetical protein
MVISEQVALERAEFQNALQSGRLDAGEAAEFAEVYDAAVGFDFVQDLMDQ